MRLETQAQIKELYESIARDAPPGPVRLERMGVNFQAFTDFTTDDVVDSFEKEIPPSVRTQDLVRYAMAIACMHSELSFQAGYRHALESVAS